MSDDDIQRCIANRLKLARENAGLTQGQVATKLTMRRPSISEIESKRRKVSADELHRFSALYKVDFDWLACAEDDELKEQKADVSLAARELSKLSQDDLGRVADLIQSLRRRGRK